MNITPRRGCPRWPMTSAQPIAPRPPAAKTSPSDSAEPWTTFFTMYGSSTSVGPRKTR